MEIAAESVLARCSFDLDGADLRILHDRDELNNDLAVRDEDREGAVNREVRPAGSGDDVEVRLKSLTVENDVEDALSGTGEVDFSKFQSDGVAAVGHRELVLERRGVKALGLVQSGRRRGADRVGGDLKR